MQVRPSIAGGFRHWFEPSIAHPPHGCHRGKQTPAGISGFRGASVGPVQRVAGGWARGARFETEAETWLVEIARVIRMVSIPDHEGALMNTLAL